MPRGKPGASQNAPKEPMKPLREQPLVAASSGREVPVVKVVPNPRNLRGEDLWESAEEKAETVASIKEVGLIQALVVATREAFLGRYPDHEADLGTARYVVMAGHRRFDAVCAAGLEKVRIDIQDDLVSKLNLVMLEENLKRKGLDPFQEGEGYRRANTEDQLSYQDIATATGRSKSHITKRVKLLDLEGDGRALVRARRVSIDSAYNLLTALGQGNAEHFIAGCEAMLDGRSAKDAANYVLSGSGRNRSAAERGESVSGTAVALTTTSVLGETSTHASPSSADEDSDGAPAIPGARNEPIPTETSAPSTSGTNSSTVTQPKSTPDTSKAQKQQPESTTNDAARSEAGALRNESCSHLLADFSVERVDPVTIRLAAAVLNAASKNALTRALSWMQAAQAPNSSMMGAASYRDAALLNSDPAVTVKFAYAVALAEDEIRATDRRRRWDHRDVSHLRHLIDAASHEPTEWEKRQLS